MAPKRILSIEDDPEYARLLQKTLAQAGYEVRGASSGAEGLARLAREGADMVFLDINLPDTTGYELCRKIRADGRHKDVPIIIISVHSDMPEIVQGLRLGADDYVTKPFNPKEVLARVASAFRQIGGDAGA